MTGFVVSDKQVWGRPVGVAVARDGSLFVTEGWGTERFGAFLARGQLSTNFLRRIGTICCTLMTAGCGSGRKRGQAELRA